jgi:hypothetical protein
MKEKMGCVQKFESIRLKISATSVNNISLSLFTCVVDRLVAYLRVTGEKRRVSCKDLGHGDCQGYLLKLKEGVFSRWVTKWCVVKDYHLYLYDSPEVTY